LAVRTHITGIAYTIATGIILRLVGDSGAIVDTVFDTVFIGVSVRRTTSADPGFQFVRIIGAAIALHRLSTRTLEPRNL